MKLKQVCSEWRLTSMVVLELDQYSGWVDVLETDSGSVGGVTIYEQIALLDTKMMEWIDTTGMGDVYDEGDKIMIHFNDPVEMSLFQMAFGLEQ